MLKKFFRNEKNIVSDLVVKKTLVKNVYPKYYNRRLIEKQFKNLEVLDGDSLLNNYSIKKNIKSYTGRSKVFNRTDYQHQQNKSLKFQYFSPVNLNNKNTKLRQFYSLMYRFKAKDSIHNCFYINKTIKGGFESSFFGTQGFIPKRSGDDLLRNLETSFFYSKTFKNFVKKYFFLKNDRSLLKKLFIQRFPGTFSLKNGLSFLRKNRNLNLPQKGKFFDFVFLHPSVQNSNYAFKKRYKNQTYKSKNQKGKDFSTDTIKSKRFTKKSTGKKII